MKINGAIIQDLDKIEVRRRTSANRLIVGGPAMLAIVATNHHMDMLGRIVRNPFVRNSLRVLVVSWFIPASENRAGEESP